MCLCAGVMDLVVLAILADVSSASLLISMSESAFLARFLSLPRYFDSLAAIYSSITTFSSS